MKNAKSKDCHNKSHSLKYLAGKSKDSNEFFNSCLSLCHENYTFTREEEKKEKFPFAMSINSVHTAQCIQNISLFIVDAESVRCFTWYLMKAQICTFHTCAHWHMHWKFVSVQHKPVNMCHAKWEVNNFGFEFSSYSQDLFLSSSFSDARVGSLSSFLSSFWDEKNELSFAVTLYFLNIRFFTVCIFHHKRKCEESSSTLFQPRC